MFRGGPASASKLGRRTAGGGGPAATAGPGGRRLRPSSAVGGGEEHAASFYHKRISEVVLWRGAAAMFWMFVVCVAATQVWTISIWHPVDSLLLSLLSLDRWGVLIVFFLTQGVLLLVQRHLLTVTRVVHRSTLHAVVARATSPTHWTLWGAFVCAGMWGVTAYFMLVGSPFLGGMSRPCVTHEGVSSTLVCLDETAWLVLAWGAFLGAYLTLRYYVRETFHLAFPTLQQGKWFRFKARLPYVMVYAVRVTAMALLVFLLGHVLVGRVGTVLVAHLLGFDNAHPMIVHQWPPLLTLSFLLSLVMAGSLFAVCALLGHHLLDITYTQAVRYGAWKGDPNRYLLAGLSYSGSKYGLYMALLDLVQMAHHSHERRDALFADTSGRAWDNVVARVTGMLSELTDRLLAEADINEGRRTRRTRSGRPRGGGGGDSAGSDGSEGSDSEGSDGAWERVGGGGGGGSEGSDGVQRDRSVGFTFSQPATWWRAALSPPSTERRIRMVLADLQLYVWAMHGLAELAAASYREDRNGVVQRTLPDVISALVECLAAAETFVATARVSSAQATRLEGNQLVHKHAYVLVRSLQSSVYRVTTTFYENLGSFSFSPDVAERLDHFLRFDA